MVEPRLEHRGRPAVVLGGAQHDDGVRRTPLVLLAHDEHEDERHREGDPGGEQEESERGEEAANDAWHPRKLPFESTHDNSNDSPCAGTWTSRTPSSRRIPAIVWRAEGSPCTQKARRTGAPIRLTHDRSSVRSAWAE